jgi:hypothetical protein
MAKRLSADEREKIDQLDGKGYKPHEMAAKIGKDTRTVKRYLNDRPRERSIEIERQQQELDHRNDVRSRIMKFKEKLKFPAPEGLDITNLSLGMRAYDIGTENIIQWQKTDNNYIVKIEDEFTPIIEHLHSSRRKVILDLLKEWQRIGGKCIVDCHRLRVDIQKEAEKQTKLRTVLETIVEGNVVRSNVVEGLLDEFSWTIYRWALCNTKEEKYITVSELNGRHLLHWGMYNLAWVKDNEMERIKDIHQKLIKNYRKVSTTLDILEGKKTLDQLAKSLSQRLNEFAGLSKLPGNCRLCPGR